MTRKNAMTDADLQNDIARISELRDEAKMMESEAKELQARALDAMVTLGYQPGEKVIAVRSDGMQVTGQIVQGTSLRIDEGKLRRRIGPAMYKKITTMVLDRKKLDAFIAAGDISPTDVAAASTVEPNTPYIKIGK